MNAKVDVGINTQMRATMCSKNDSIVYCSFNKRMTRTLRVQFLVRHLEKGKKTPNAVGSRRPSSLISFRPKKHNSG